MAEDYRALSRALEITCVMFSARRLGGKLPKVHGGTFGSLNYLITS